MISFHIKLKDGRPVQVNFFPDYMPSSHHFEFHGMATSETGYRSEFVFKDTYQDWKKQGMDLKSIALNIAEDLAKDVKPQTKQLF